MFTLEPKVTLAINVMSTAVSLQERGARMLVVFMDDMQFTAQPYSDKVLGCLCAANLLTFERWPSKTYGLTRPGNEILLSEVVYCITQGDPTYSDHQLAEATMQSLMCSCMKKMYELMAGITMADYLEAERMQLKLRSMDRPRLSRSEYNEVA